MSATRARTARNAIRSRFDEADPVSDRPSPLALLGGGAERVVFWSGIHEAFGVAPSDAGTDGRRIRGLVVLGAAVVCVMSPVVGLGVAAVGWNLPRLVAGREQRRRDVEVADQLLLAIELLAVATRSGASISDSISVVAGRIPGRVGSVLALVGERSGPARRLDTGLVQLGDDLGSAADPLVAVLRAALLDGDPLAPALDRLVAAMRDGQRRKAETEARRTSVRMLLPLVCCVLPAFALISVVPVVVDALTRLPR